MAHGNVYAPEKVDAALRNYFRVGNLTALRELALLWLADKVDEQLDRYRAEHGIAGTWEARERVVVALTGGPEGDTLIRRAARIAARTKGADLLAVHVTRSDGLAGADPAQPGPPARRWSRAWAAPTTRSSATTSRGRCSTSPAGSPRALDPGRRHEQRGTRRGGADRPTCVRSAGSTTRRRCCRGHPSSSEMPVWGPSPT